VARPSNQAERFRLLLLEDEAVIAMDLEQSLTEIGFEVVGPFRRSSDALAALERTAVDLAVLDYLLGDQTSDSVADRLEHLGVPYLFLTGCHKVMRHDGRGGAPILGKPVSHERMTEALGSLCSQVIPGGRTGRTGRAWARRGPRLPRCA
jgi:DNA-binding response OmpR family regulator